MNKIFICFLILFQAVIFGQTSEKALLLIDIQEFYFAEGKNRLVNPEMAADKAALVLQKCRAAGYEIVHIKHKSKLLHQINKRVQPLQTEKIFEKSEVSCFNGTGLNSYLKLRNVKEVIICGMMTHMCVEAASRAGYDLGYKITLISDACTTRDLKFGKEIIKAGDVHNSTLATLTAYAKIADTETFLKEIDGK